MSKDYLYKFRRKMSIDGNDLADTETLELRDTFNGLIDDRLTPTVHTVRYVPRENVGIDNVGKEIGVNVTDTSKNDQKSNDEKYFDFKWEEGVKIGDQIYWDGMWWIMYHQELNAVMSHRTFTAKKANYEYKFKLRDKVYVFPVLLLNLTLYSDGMSDKVYLSSQEGNRRITLPDNEITKNIKVGTRILLTQDDVFQVGHMDDFSRPGVKDCILTQIFTTSSDDLDNNIAHNEFEDIETEEDIFGSQYIYLGNKEIYTYKTTVNGIWQVISDNNCVKIDTQYAGCRLICEDNFDYIGTKVTLNYTKNGKVLASKEITVKGMF